MASRESAECQVKEVEAARVCINKVLTDADDELRAVLVRLEREEEKDTFGLVCKRWLRLQSSERRRLRARAGPAMLRRMAARFSDLVELDLSQSPSRSFYPGVTDSDLSVIAAGFRGLRILISRTVKVSYALGALYYLCNPSTKKEILKPEVVEVIRKYAAAEGVNMTFSNLANAFLDEHVNQ